MDQNLESLTNGNNSPNAPILPVNMTEGYNRGIRIIAGLAFLNGVYRGYCEGTGIVAGNDLFGILETFAPAVGQAVLAGYGSGDLEIDAHYPFTRAAANFGAGVMITGFGYALGRGIASIHQ
jgi:hypothetical protein